MADEPTSHGYASHKQTLPRDVPYRVIIQAHRHENTDGPWSNALIAFSSFWLQRPLAARRHRRKIKLLAASIRLMPVLNPA